MCSVTNGGGLGSPHPRPDRLNVCHLSLDTTPSFSAISTLGQVINACDLVNLGCPESISAPQWEAQNLLPPAGVSFSDHRWTYICPLKKEPCCESCIYKRAECICMSECWLSGWGLVIFVPYDSRKLTSCSRQSNSVTRLLWKLSGNLLRELWPLRGPGEIAPLAVLSGGAAGLRQCSI